MSKNYYSKHRNLKFQNLLKENPSLISVIDRVNSIEEALSGFEEIHETIEQHKPLLIENKEQPSQDIIETIKPLGSSQPPPSPPFLPDEKKKDDNQKKAFGVKFSVPKQKRGFLGIPLEDGGVLRDINAMAIAKSKFVINHAEHLFGVENSEEKGFIKSIGNIAKKTEKFFKSFHF